jgi:hypothetical protein
VPVKTSTKTMHKHCSRPSARNDPSRPPSRLTRRPPKLVATLMKNQDSLSSSSRHGHQSRLPV